MSVSFVRRTALAAAALPLLLAGCTEDEPVPQFPDPTTPTRSPSASETTTAATPEPWEEKSEEGAVAFVRHWFDLLNDARLEGKTRPLAAASTRPCATCANFVKILDGWQTSGLEYKSGEWTIEEAVFITRVRNSFRIGVEVHRPREVLIEADGKTTRNGASNATFSATVRWRSGEWLMHEVVFPQ